MRLSLLLTEYNDYLYIIDFLCVAVLEVLSNYKFNDGSFNLKITFANGMQNVTG